MLCISGPISSKAGLPIFGTALDNRMFEISDYWL